MKSEPIYNHAAINEAIARKCGFVWVDADGVCSGHYYNEGQEGIWSDIPSYTTSLDAMAEARKVMNETEQDMFTEHLWDEFGWEGYFDRYDEPLWDSLYKVLTASSIHHAIAFCKACGIWDEKKMIKKEM